MAEVAAAATAAIPAAGIPVHAALAKRRCIRALTHRRSNPFLEIDVTATPT